MQPLPQYKATMASYLNRSGSKSSLYLIHINLVITNLRTINILNNYSKEEKREKIKELFIGGAL